MQMSEEAGLELYSLLGNLQWPAFAGILLWASLCYKVPAKHKIFLWVSFVVSRFWSGNMVPVLSSLTKGIIPGANMGVAFGMFVLFMASIAYFAHTPILFSLDATIPAFVLGRGLAIIGCIFAGCCYGFPVSWGIYSNVTKTLTFPTVFLDSAVSCGIVIYLICLSAQKKYSGDGTVAAMGMLFFGLLRVLIDILRDNEKLFFMLTSEGMFGLAYVICGYLLLRYIYHKR